MDLFSGVVDTCEMVFWYPAGNKRKQPYPAIVRVGQRRGVCDLTVINSDVLQAYNSVCHVSHPSVASGVAKSPTPGVKKNGCWDFRNDEQRRKYAQPVVDQEPAVPAAPEVAAEVELATPKDEPTLEIGSEPAADKQPDKPAARQVIPRKGRGE